MSRGFSAYLLDCLVNLFILKEGTGSFRILLLDGRDRLKTERKESDELGVIHKLLCHNMGGGVSQMITWGRGEGQAR